LGVILTVLHFSLLFVLLG